MYLKRYALNQAALREHDFEIWEAHENFEISRFTKTDTVLGRVIA
jgi:hypothetical protein